MKVFKILGIFAQAILYCALASSTFATIIVTNQGGAYKPCVNSSAPAGSETILSSDSANDPGPLYPYPNSGGLWNYSCDGVLNLSNTRSSAETITVNMHLGSPTICGSWYVGNTCYYTSPFTITIPGNSDLNAPWNFLIGNPSNDRLSFYMTAVVPSGGSAIKCLDQSYTTTEHENQ
jgi:hypothetical protein